MDAKQLEKMMGFAPGELEKPQRPTKKMNGRKVALSSWEGRQSLMNRASFYRHVWASRFLKRLTKKPNAMGKHARSGSENSLHLMQ